MTIPKDKLLHFGACFALDAALVLLGLWTPILRFLFVAVGIGGAKEIYDWKHPEAHDADWQDMAADAAGAATAEILAALGAVL